MNNFLNAQIEKSFADKQTALFLKRLVFHTVDMCAREHYQSAYSLKCLQTSVATQDCLKNLGIRSQLFAGAVCFAQVFKDESIVGIWGGFWDKNHHIWLYTEFDEFIDLSITQHTQHPACTRSDGIAPPAIWWKNVTRWPSVIHYLPDMPIWASAGNPDGVKDLNAFQAMVSSKFHNVIEALEESQIVFPAILEGMESMHALHEQGHPWLVGAKRFEQRGIPFPEWIQMREAELAEARKINQIPPSRLSKIKGFLATDEQNPA
jgi:hypothetical protein